MELELTSQNLRDQASYLEKTLGNVRVTISNSNSLGRTNDAEPRESNLGLETELTSPSDMQTREEEADLHLNIPSNQQVPLGCPVAPSFHSINKYILISSFVSSIQTKLLTNEFDLPANQRFLFCREQRLPRKVFA